MEFSRCTLQHSPVTRGCTECDALSHAPYTESSSEPEVKRGRRIRAQERSQQETLTNLPRAVGPAVDLSTGSVVPPPQRSTPLTRLSGARGRKGGSAM